MKRQIITIDEERCNGCGECVKGCHEGALQMVDGKARMISDLYCDGLGACIGSCPVDAITIEEREAEPYDEEAVMERIAPKGEATIIAHLKHLKDHGERGYLHQGVEYIQKHGLKVDLRPVMHGDTNSGSCPGAMSRSFAAPTSITAPAATTSQLTHWPVQLHLLNPEVGHFFEADVVLAADCTAYAFPDFHNRFLKGRKLAIACPKLDSNKESYIEKITTMIDKSKINSLIVVIMEVPCCGGLIQIAKLAVEKAQRKVPVRKIVVGIQGNVLEDVWI